MKPGVSFFCPAYNDEGNIRRTVECALEAFAKLALDHEIVIVEDGSPDNTAAEADRLAEEFDTVRVIHHDKNRGYGGALKSGFNEANTFELVTYTDGDGQFDFSEFEKLLEVWEEGFCITGYRLQRAEGFRRKLQNKVYGFLLRIMFGLKVKDVNCSMKLFQRKHLNQIEIKSNSTFLDAEILIKLGRLGIPVKEVAVHHYPRLHGEASGKKFSVISDTIRDMFSYWLHAGKPE